MTERLTIALAQLNQRVGDLDANAAAMLDWRAKAAGADLILFPELQLTGYPPEDLVLKPEFVRRTHEATDKLIEATAESGPAILFGTLIAEGGSVYNAMVLAEDGKLVGRTLKHELPNYGTFDEKRVFASGPLPEPIVWRGVKLGVPICEDIWQDRVCAHLAAAGADLLLVPNGSPFELDKDDKGSAWCAAGSYRPAWRSPISTASAARTNWRSTARRSSSTPTASGSCRCATGRSNCC